MQLQYTGLANHYLSYSSHHGHVLQVSVFCSCTLLLCLGMYSMVFGLSARRLLRDEKNTDFCRPYRRQKMEKTRAMLWLTTLCVIMCICLLHPLYPFPPSAHCQLAAPAAVNCTTMSRCQCSGDRQTREACQTPRVLMAGIDPNLPFVLRLGLVLSAIMTFSAEWFGMSVGY